MSVMVQIRNMPETLHRKLKARAAAAGVSLSDYLLQMARRDAEAPTLEEFRARLAKRKSIELPESPTQALREERDSR